MATVLASFRQRCYPDRAVTRVGEKQHFRRHRSAGIAVQGSGAMIVHGTSRPWDSVTGASGDWHDVIRLPTGDRALVVGDVAGRGIQATALKGMLQPAVRRLACAGIGPAEIFTCQRAAGLAVGAVSKAPPRPDTSY
jgi:hypothetical protein